MNGEMKGEMKRWKTNEHTVGEITVSSKRGKGTTFKFTIQCGRAVETEPVKGITPLPYLLLLSLSPFL